MKQLTLKNSTDWLSFRLRVDHVPWVRSCTS